MVVLFSKACPQRRRRRGRNLSVYRPGELTAADALLCKRLDAANWKMSSAVANVGLNRADRGNFRADSQLSEQDAGQHQSGAEDAASTEPLSENKERGDPGKDWLHREQ